jgi:succinate dehydrogenase/fumarate reductase cytochrome b subunit (b558 family)
VKRRPTAVGVVLASGVLAAAVFAASGIVPHITHWEDRSRVTRQVLGDVPAAVQVTFYTVILFVVFHLLDLTWGTANPYFVRGEVYNNVVTSFRRWPVASVYIAANAALGFHLYHGAWSLFQSMGWNHPRWNPWRRWFAGTFAIVVALGNISFPIAVLAHVVN